MESNWGAVIWLNTAHGSPLCHWVMTIVSPKRPAPGFLGGEMVVLSVSSPLPGTTVVFALANGASELQIYLVCHV